MFVPIGHNLNTVILQITRSEMGTTLNVVVHIPHESYRDLCSKLRNVIEVTDTFVASLETKWKL